MMVTHCANALKVLERSRFGPRHLVSVEVKGCHSAQQKIGRVRTKAREPAEFASGHADILSHAPPFSPAAAPHFHPCGTSSVQPRHHCKTALVGDQRFCPTGT